MKLLTKKSWSPYLLGVGPFLGFLWGTCRSISRHAAAANKKALAAPDASELRLSRFMQSLPGLAWMKDTEGRYVYANDAAMKAFKKDQGELYGFSDADILPPETAAEFMEDDRRAMREPGGILLTKTLRHGDGSLRSSLVRKFPIPGPEGSPTWVGGIAIDITDRLRAEEALKDGFLATLAHELRTHLSPIHFSVEICRLQADPAKRDGALNMIDRQVRQLSRILDNLLDVSRISCGKLTLRPERVELADIVARAVQTSLPLRNEIGQSLDLSLPGHPVILHADPVRLEQVFAHLLNNAAKYGGRNSQATLSVATNGDTTVVTIRDNGAGIPADRLDNIFDMFSHEKGSSGDSHGGLGLGLPLVKGLLHLHSGDIEARSEGAGSGSEFIVRLPLHTENPGAESPGALG